MELGQRKAHTGAELAITYDGGRYASTKIRTLQKPAQTAIRMETKVIAELGDIMNSENPEVVQKLEGISNSIEEVPSVPECRVLTKYITFNSSRSAAAFISERNTKSQIGTLNILMVISTRNGFKSVS